MRTQVLRKHLKAIMGNRRVITKRAVVDAAAPKRHPLHNQFTWDNSIAADKHRLWEAGRLITRANVMIEYDGKQSEVQAFFSLPSSRISRDGGYTPIENIMGHAELQQQVLSQAKSELIAWRQRYEHLDGLAKIWKRVRIIETELVTKG